MLEFIIVGISLVLISVVELIQYNPPSIFGIYRRKNGFYWLKVALVYVLLSLRKLSKKKEDEEQKLANQIDRPQQLSVQDKAIDAVYLNGANKHGDHLVVGMARRKNRLIDGFLYLKINHSKFGLLESPKLPSTSLYQTEEAEEYAAEGIKMTPLEPMRSWKLTYEGQMKEATNSNVVHDVKVDGTWVTDLPYFNYDSDMDPLCMAKSMAYEEWSRTYFQNLNRNHQTHYEQFGRLKGKVTVDGEQFELALDTVRDHSFGVHREWRQFKRYAEHYFTSANGDYFNVGIICLPISFSCLTIGHVYSSKYDKIFPVTDCDLQLYQHGALGTPPKDYAFSFAAGDKKYTVQVTVIDLPHFYISKDWEAKIYEGLCKFKVNGVNGWGATEWQYRNIEGTEVPDFLKPKRSSSY